ncbi:MAG: hypothetical protein KA085_13195 [Phenylobacterium sp.]|uniref:hypothetical protein n=1 Tax=Phenylobacterium sp. TaxID=1871053 RepID=UPI001B7735E3|nr:hypothetical protein [Phenylobacterium sp.]MBP7817079.1 hypothetical protein [Phenylobacterium sp.]
MSQDRRDQLVEDIVDAQPELRAFVRHQPLDLIPLGSWDMLSYSFQRGFEALWDSAQVDRSGLLLRPLLLLWRQSVELAIKAAVLEISGESASDLGHDLSKLFAKLLAVRADLGCVDDDEYTDRIRAMIALVQAFDPFADRFRYPTAKKGRPYEGVTVDLDELFQAHWSIVTWCEGAAIEIKEGRSPA